MHRADRRVFANDVWQCMKFDVCSRQYNLSPQGALLSGSELSEVVRTSFVTTHSREVSVYDVQSILSWKGSTVYTVKSTASVACAAKALADHDIGALVVTGAEGGTVGIVSERDVLRALWAEGAVVLARPVAEIMTSQIMTCTLQEKLVGVMERMMEGRLRHLPVIEDGQLVGIISIRDVVRSRLEEKEREVAALRERVEKVENLLRQIQISRL